MLLEALSKQSKVSIDSLNWLAFTASQRYKVYEIPKRNGGVRTIHHPSKTLKSIQRWMSRFLFKKFPVHQSATAYSRGSSIYKNANAHVDCRFTLRVDFRDFFPSFLGPDVGRFIATRGKELGGQLTSEDIEFIVKICSKAGRLTIGAPSSPIITNIMMYDFDSKASLYCSSKAQIYTRYADDIFISSNSPNVLGESLNYIRSLSNSYDYARLRINEEKTAFLSRRYRRSITGLVLTPDGRLSVGRDRKREIKALVHQFLNEKLNIEEVERLRGLLAFCSDCEPDFIVRLNDKYGRHVMNNLVKSNYDDVVDLI